MKIKFLTIFLLLSLINCKKAEKDTSSYYKGQLTILADDSFQSVTQALADGYMINYPDSHITIANKKEDLAFLDLLNEKAKIIVMSRDLTPAEKSEYEKITELKYQPAKFAADAVVFIVPKESTRTSISLDEIKKGLEDEKKPYIFDGTNSSNLNFVAQKFHKKPSELKFSIINGNENLVNEISNFPDKIGVIGYNAISRPYSESAKKLREKIKILSISDQNQIFDLSTENLRTMQYPFTRVLYFLDNESGFNMANGFIRFSCTQIGQKIVEKEGLQPYNIYKREVEMR